MANDSTYFVGQGSVFMAPRTFNGAINGGFTALGDVDKLEIDVNQKFDDIEESQSGNRLVAAHVPVGATYSFKMNVLNWSAANLAKFLYAASTGASASGGTVASEAITAYSGTMCPLQNPGVSAVVLKTTDATPVTLVAGTDYTVDAANGTVTFLTGSTIVTGTTGKPLTAAYSYTGYNGKIEAVTTTIPEICLRFNGMNTANGASPVIVTLKRVSLNIAKTLSLLDNKHGSLEIDGMLLPDPTVTAGSGISQFYNIVKV